MCTITTGECYSIEPPIKPALPNAAPWAGPASPQTTLTPVHAARTTTTTRSPTHVKKSVTAHLHDCRTATSRSCTSCLFPEHQVRWQLDTHEQSCRGGVVSTLVDATRTFGSAQSRGGLGGLGGLSQPTNKPTVPSVRSFRAKNYSVRSFVVLACALDTHCALNFLKFLFPVAPLLVCPCVCVYVCLRV